MRACWGKLFPEHRDEYQRRKMEKSMERSGQQGITNCPAIFLTIY